MAQEIDRLEDKLERTEKVIDAARKVIRTHPMSHSRDEQIHKLLEAIAVYDKKNSDELATKCSASGDAEAEIKSLRNKLERAIFYKDNNIKIADDALERAERAEDEVEQLREKLSQTERNAHLANSVIEAARGWCRNIVVAKWFNGSSIVRDDFAPRELELFDAIIAYDKGEQR